MGLTKFKDETGRTKNEVEKLNVNVRGVYGLSIAVAQYNFY